jgi:hypothetical protein
MIPTADIAQLQAAFQFNARDLGIGLNNPSTGVIRLGSLDRVTLGKGHQGLADALSISDVRNWRGFVIRSDAKFFPTSHFNLVDGKIALRADHEDYVRKELQQAGLIS